MTVSISKAYSWTRHILSGALGGVLYRGKTRQLGGGTPVWPIKKIELGCRYAMFVTVRTKFFLRAGGWTVPTFTPTMGHLKTDEFERKKEVWEETRLHRTFVSHLRSQLHT